MSSTGARGAALYGGALTASPKACNAGTWFSKVPYTTPDKR